MLKKIPKILLSISVIVSSAFPVYAKNDQSYENKEVAIYVASYSSRDWSPWQTIVPGLQFSYKIMGKECINCYGFVRFKNTSSKKIFFEGDMYYDPVKDGSDHTLIITSIEPGEIDQDMGSWYIGQTVNKIKIRKFDPDQN